jgi:hypothetical protein
MLNAHGRIADYGADPAGFASEEQGPVRIVLSEDDRGIVQFQLTDQIARTGPVPEVGPRPRSIDGKLATATI